MKKLVLSALVCSILSVAVGEGQQSYLHDPSNVENIEHIKQHMSEFGGDTEGLTETEALQFHYFKLHDHDNNNKLDGLELGAAMTHFHEMSDEGADVPPSGIAMEDDELSNLVDLILKEDDLNDDGYVDYYEFVMAQRRHQPEAPPTQDSRDL